uniref:Major facilitator superfamily (MFS) profile domain-containing protein n=1 Tax=Favella ehrenbergii TaxID=182087 RepID=A0A7S3I8E4_9SPIT|mmetsp:Transcript_10879/g.14656  ORF Transcript_10879/g.14656 Transcript_10879/m.14656 type:complete len:118 (+) Transcript_10879:1143-1496(+)
MVPVAFLVRGICGFSFMLMDNPESFMAMAICVVLIVFTVLEAISIEVLFFKGMPSQIRGTMMGCFAFFGQLGTLLFTLIGGQMFDRIGRNSPFVFLAAMDTFLVVLALTMACLGKFK